MTEVVKRGRGRPRKEIRTDESQPKLRIKLLCNYRPMSRATVHEAAPPPFEGVGSPEKLWKGSVISLPKDEAIRLLTNHITNVVKTKNQRGEDEEIKVEVPHPLAIRADEFNFEPEEEAEDEELGQTG